MNPAPPVTMTAIAVIYPQMFITLEGLDGSGKTTQATLLGARLEADGAEVVLTREPGGTSLGEEIRDLVLHGGDVAPWAEATLYAAARAQHVERADPARARARRDGHLRPLPRFVGRLPGNRPRPGARARARPQPRAVGGLLPDRTILLELGVGDAAARMGGDLDRIEREDDDFRARVAAAYRDLAERFPDRYVTVDGTAPPEVIAEEIYGACRSLRSGS